MLFNLPRIEIDNDTTSCSTRKNQRLSGESIQSNDNNNNNNMLLSSSSSSSSSSKIIPNHQIPGAIAAATKATSSDYSTSSSASLLFTQSSPCIDDVAVTTTTTTPSLSTSPTTSSSLLARRGRQQEELKLIGRNTSPDSFQISKITTTKPLLSDPTSNKPSNANNDSPGSKTSPVRIDNNVNFLELKEIFGKDY